MTKIFECSISWSQNVRAALTGFTATVLGAVCLPSCSADPAYDFKDQFQWDRYTCGEQTNFTSKGGNDPVPARVRRQQMEAAMARAKAKTPDASVPVGSFQVPSWVVTQAPVFQRPTEIINNYPRTDSTIYAGSTFITPLASAYTGFAGSWAAPYCGGGSRALSFASSWAPGGWGGYGYGWGAPNLGATLALAGAARNFAPGIGYGGWGGYGGYGGGGYGFSPTLAGLGFRRGPICDPGGGKVFQSGPSKASGNYYQPSTVDPSASGSYYASTGPSQVLIGPSEPPPKDYWGPDGNPFKNQLVAP